MGNSAFNQNQTGFASETAAGTVEEATQAQADAGIDTGETGGRLFVPPSKILQMFPAYVPSYPIVESTAGSSSRNTSALVVATLPSGIQVGDLLIAIFTSTGGFTTTPEQDGWVKIGMAAGEQNNIYVKIATGINTFTYTPNSALYEASVNIYRISNYWDGLNIEDIVTALPQGTTYSQTTPPPINPLNELRDYLFIVGLTYINVGTVTTIPTGYGSLVSTVGIGSGSDKTQVHTATRGASVVYERPTDWITAGTVSNKTTSIVAVRGPNLNINNAS